MRVILLACVLVCSVLAVAGQTCPAVKTHLEVHTINTDHAPTPVSRLLWRAEPLPATGNSIRGVRYVDAHCRVNDRDEYNVRMAVAASTTMAITSPVLNALDATFVADLSLTNAADKAVCWFTYELELVDGRVLDCDSEAAFSFQNRNVNAPSSASWVGAPSPIMGSGSGGGGGAVMSSNEFALPTLAASEVCPAINYQQKVLACPNKPGCVYVVFEAVSARIASTTLNLLAVDVHLRVRTAVTNLNIRMQPPTPQTRAQLNLGASPLIMLSDPIDTGTTSPVDIVYSFTYAVELAGYGRADCDTQVFSTRVNSNVSPVSGLDMDAAAAGESIELRTSTSKHTKCTYVQKTGHLTCSNGIDHYGYSGAGKGKNNPDMEDVEDVGPIPVGDYTISGVRAHPTPQTLVLSGPSPNPTGRSGFLIHGDDKTHTASAGCIIMPPDVRKQLQTGDTIHVVANE